MTVAPYATPVTPSVPPPGRHRRGPSPASPAGSPSLTLQVLSVSVPRTGSPPAPAASPATRPDSLIASVVDDEPGRGVVVLAGRLGEDGSRRLAGHLADLLDAGVREIVVEAGGLVDAPTTVLALLGRTQQTLTGRHGLLSIRGLRPGALPPETSERP